MRKLFTLIAFVFSFLHYSNLSAQVNHVVINQVYGGGGNTSAVYLNDFVELYNPTTSAVSINGWSVQYASAAGTSWSAATLTGSIAPGGYILVKLASGGSVGSALPAAEATNTGINMSATAGKVALVNNSTALSGSCPLSANTIDLVGYGSTASCFEGSFAPAPANATALIRASTGCTDNNTNNTDFSVGTPTPRNSSSPTKICPTGATLSTVVASGVTATAAVSGGSITSDGTSPTTSRGVVWNTGPAPTTANFKTTDGAGSGTFSSAISPLNANTKYYYRAYAVNSTNTAYGNELILTTLPNAPGIGTASNILATGFTANWTSPSGGSELFSYTLEVDDDAAFGSLNFTQSGINSATLSAPVTGLSSSTTYYYRLKAINSTGASVYSAVSAPVQTNAPATPTISLSNSLSSFVNTCINTDSATQSFTLGGSDLDGSALTIGALNGFSFSENSGGPFTATLSFNPGMNFSGKVIYLRFSPTTVQSYDGNISVSGGGAAPISVAATGTGINTPATVLTDGSTVAGTTANLSGHVVAAGCGAVTTYGFEYSTTSGFANGSGTVVAANVINANYFSAALSSLAGGVTYYYKAFVTTSAGTSYGAQGSFTTSAIVPVPMASQSLYRYTEDFSAVGTWTNNFISGAGANRFSSVPTTSGTGIPNPTSVTTSTTSFSSGTSGGVQKGTGNIVLLATGGTDNNSSVAIDFYMDFTGLNAGTLSFDWAALANSTGNRNASLRVYATVDGINFTELTAAAVLNYTNNVPASGTVSSVQLPASFSNSATARLRFYVYNGTGPAGSSGSRPKITIDNLTVTGVNSTPCATPTAGATALTFGAMTDSTIAASFTAASPAPNEYLVIVSTNSSLTSNPIDGQVYNVGDNVGDGDVIAKGTALNFTATQLDGATTYYFYIFPVNSVCTGGPKYSVANVLTGSTTTPAGLPQCAAPANQPANLVFGATGINTVSGSFTAADGNEYLVLQSSSSSLSATPANGYIYSAGDILGNAKVVQRSSNTSFNAAGLNPATTYYFYVISLNSQGCLNGPVYNTVNPLTASAATQPLPACATPTAQPGNLSLNATNSAVAGTFNGITNSNYQYLVVRSTSASLSAVPTDNTDYNPGDNLGGGVVVSSSASSSFSTGGLSATTTYYFFVFAMDKNCSGGTKYLASSPLTGNITTTNTPPNNYYFGTLHAHSDYSDGNEDHPGYTPTDDYAFALGSRGMDFLGISEHNHFSSVNNPGNELAKYHSGLVEAVNFTASHPGFLALYGMEWGVISGGGHVVVYGDGLNDLFGWESNVNGNVGPNYDVYVPKSTYTGPTGLFKTINDYAAKNAFGTLAHPKSTDFNNLSNNPYDQQADDAISGVAVETGPAFSTNTTYSDPGASMSLLWYYQKMLAKGYHLGPTIDHDTHNTTFGRATKARTAVIAPALTQTELMKAIHDMHFYATEDYDTKVDFTVNNRIMGSIFEDRNAPTIAVNVTDTSDDYSGALIRVYAGTPGSGVNAVVVDSVFGSSLTFVDNSLPNNATGYYYIDITKGTTRTVTSPVWYTRKCTITNDLNITACDNYTWNSTVYTTSTVVSQTYTTTSGCDSTVTLHLTINNSPASATVTAAGGLSGCPSSGVALSATVNDGGNGAITGYQWSFNGVPVAGATAATYTTMQSGNYAFTATNAGNCSVSSGLVTVSVSDNVPPTVVTQNIVVALDASGNATVSAAQVNNGSSDNCGIGSINLSQTSFNCSNLGANSVVLTVTDVNGNVATGNATITVVDNSKPTVVTQNITVALNAGGTATVTAAQINNGSADNCGIASMVLDKTSFTCANIGVNTVKLTVTDNSGNVDFATATVTVTGTTYVTNTTSGKTFCTIQSAINDAQTVGGNTLEVQPGTYNEQVVVNKGVTLRGVGASQPVVDFIGTVAGAPTVFYVSANNVTIDNFNIRADLTKFKSAVIASGAGVVNVAVTNNRIDGYASSAANSAGSFGDRNAVSVNYAGSTNYRVATNVNIVFTGNTVTGSNSRYFRAGIAADEAGGTFTGNTIQSIAHDILVRFGTNNGVNITNNNFNGGGVELADFNAGSGSLILSGNTFNAAFANVASPGTAVLRLKNNYNGRATTVSNNSFVDHEWGISLENYNAANIDNNSFTPLSTSTSFHHITVNTKSISTNSASIVQKAIGASITRNSFNAGTSTGGTALMFLNHDADAASFGTLQIGSPGNENNFSAGIKSFIALDNQSGASNGAVFPDYNNAIGGSAGAITTMAPWAPAIFAVNNKFDAGSGLKTPATMSDAELFAVEDKVQHAIDLSSLGFVTVKTGNTYVTPNSFLAPATTSASIQRAVNAAANSFTVNVSAGQFADNVTVNKQVTVKGQGEGNTTVVPAVSNPDCGGAGGGSICAGSSNVFLVKANGVTLTQFTINGDNPALAGGINVGGANIDARNGVITDHTSGTYTNLTVDHLTVKNIFLRGIYQSTAGSFLFRNNTIDNVRGNGSSIALFNFGGSGAMQNNTVSNANDAIASNWSTGTLFENNTVTASGSGIHSDNNGGNGGNADLIQNNNISNSTANGYGIWVFAPYKPVVVRNNTVSNVDVGLAAAGQNAPVTTVFERNTVDGQNKAGSTGVYVTTNLFGFGSANVSSVFQNNFIRNNADGFYLESEGGYTLDLQAHNNSITGNGNSNVTFATGASGAGAFGAHMECNWWGTANNAAILASIKDGTAVVSPRLTSGTDTDPGTAGFQPAPNCANAVANVQVTGTTAVSCYGGANGTATIAFANGTAGMTYSLNGGPAVAVSGSPFTISSLAAGSYTLVLTDADGNTAGTSFTITQPAAPITVNYTFTPILCNGGLSTQNITINGGTAPYSVTNQGGGVFVSGASEGVTYGGNTGNTYAATYTYTVTDAKGCTNVFNVVIPQPAALVVTASATNIVCKDGTSTITVNATGGTAPYTGAGAYNVAAGTYTYTVTDANGCSGSVTVTPTVVPDVTNPTITAAADISVNADPGKCEASNVVLGTPVTADNCTVANVTSNAPSVFPVGTTIVTWTVTDNSGNTATATQKVTVSDNQKPTITAPGNWSVVNDPGQCGAHIANLGTPVVNDNCGAVTYSNDHPSDYFPVGTTIVVWTATDSHGNNSDTVQQKITVIDNEAPTITVSNISVSNTPGQCGATVVLAAPATGDNCAVANVSNDHPGSNFPVGVTAVHWTVTDVHGLHTAVTQLVTVTDTEQPVINAPAALALCKNGTNNYTIPAAGISDNCGVASISYSVTGATSRNGTGADASGNFAAGVSTITWTVTDVNGKTNTAGTTATINSAPAVTITVSTPDAFCNKTVLTASGSAGSSYQWYAGSTAFGNSNQVELSLANSDGIYSVIATANGCAGSAASYEFKKQNIAASYTILTYKDAKIGKYNKVNSGSVGVMGNYSEAEFKSYSSVTGAGSFVKAPRIDKQGSNIIINQQVIGVATVALPTMQLNTASTRYLPSFNASTQNATVNGNFSNLTVKKGVSITATGNTFGTVKLEEGASIRFTNPVLNIESLTADKGAKNGNMSYLRFAPGSSVRISNKVSFGSQVWVNPDNAQVTFYMGDLKSDDEKFTVTGGNTRITANVFMPDGKLKVTSTDSDDDNHDACDHRAHTAATCKHRGHDHNDCDHKAHNAGDCNDDVYMTGLFIAETVESRGNTVIWNSYSCGTPPAVLTGTNSATNQKMTAETANVVTSETDLKVTVMPNPSTTYFTLKFESRYETPLNLRVMDAGGRVVDARSKLGANSTLQIGHNYSSGKYFAEVTQGGIRKVVQLIKGR